MHARSLACTMLLVCLAACQPAEQSGERGIAATFVGSPACASCHADEFEAWSRSHHAAAMQVASIETVRGDFADAHFDYAGVESTFFRRDGEFWASTDGPDGMLQEFRVKHTFGIEPLQQYLVDLPGGRLQALSIAWDTRDDADGGGRWFHLYPNQNIDSDDPLHWTGRYQNWNTMCAECHSTNLAKNYDIQTDQFATTFSEISVGCEACHGPGAQHVADPAVPLRALAPVDREWIFDAGAPIARLARDPGAPPQLETCAPCHSRRSQLSDEYGPGTPFLDGFRPTLLEPGLYHADGQILDEVYVYGSFVQSAMAAAGVTCSDCHEPHSATLRADGNAVCARCHLPAAFDTAAHHHHDPGSAGAQCVACHMRAEPYMVVDPRRDHSFRIPRPALSARVGSSDPCSDCHADQASGWAAEQVAAWYPGGRHTASHYGDALHAGRTWSADAVSQLRAVIENAAEPAIARATALGLLAVQLDAGVADTVRRALDDPEPLVRLAAIDQLAALPAATRARLGQRFLTDPLRAIRVAAARAVVDTRDQLDSQERQAFNAALAEYIAVQELNADRGAGLANLGNLAIALGDLPQAEQYFQTAIARDPAFQSSYVNLADLYRSQGREAESRQALEDGLAVHPGDPALHLALGLALTRASMPAEALEHFRAAAARASAAPQYQYVLGVALGSSNRRQEALDTLRLNHERFPRHRDTLVALATMLRDAGDYAAALTYAHKLLALTPADPAGRALVAELEAAAAG